ncbi:MAG: hypothetical protein K0Q78_1579, partial [Cellvibrio sp.]|nr:hypothetical protein [Cellvibrio sp.]
GEVELDISVMAQHLYTTVGQLKD